MNAVQIRLVQADTPELLDAAREIFREYAASLQVDLCFQNFEAELAGLPGNTHRPAARCCWPMPMTRSPAVARCGC